MNPGEVLAGRWEILSPIGAGGVGDVFRARHVVSQRLCALKVIRPRGGYDEAAAVRFEREASAPARIGHPGIVEVLDAGTDPERGLLFIAMELLEGSTLRARMGPQALGWIAALLEPLAAAHARGFVHRDLKPENVFLDRSDGAERVKLLDFGLVRLTEDVGITGDDATMGTPWYMAPEQALSARSVSPAADCWSVGVMLYEAIAGALPYSQPSLPAHLMEIQRGEHVPLRQRAPAVSPPLAELVEQCLSTDPTRRPRDAGALLARLRALGIHPPRPSLDEVGATVPAGAPLAPPTGQPAHAIPATRTPPPSGPAATAPPAPPRRSRLGCVLAALAVGSLVLAAAAAGGYLAFTYEPARTIRGNGYTLELPDAFRPMSITVPGGLAQYEDPVDPAEGGVPVRLYVATYAYSGSAEGFAAEAAQSSVDNGMTIERNAPASLGGVAGRELELAADHVEGSYGQVQRVVVTHGRAWVVGCSGPLRTFDEVRPRCERVFDSLRFTDG